jgi:NhaP-type Na+/H+ or K+/H+ antiporter
MGASGKNAGYRIGGAIRGAIFGVILGIGAGIFLSQMNVLNMNSKISLAVPVVGAVLGIVIGAMGGRAKR